MKRRTSPTFQAVTAGDNFTGLGKWPAFTQRHKVGALIAKRACCAGRLGSRTNSAARRKALSGRESKDVIENDMLRYCVEQGMHGREQCPFRIGDQGVL